jgi:hypothetical protein
MHKLAILKCEDNNLKGSSVYGEFKKRRFFKNDNVQKKEMMERIEVLEKTFATLDRHHK